MRNFEKCENILFHAFHMNNIKCMHNIKENFNSFSPKTYSLLRLFVANTMLISESSLLFDQVFNVYLRDKVILYQFHGEVMQKLHFSFSSIILFNFHPFPFASICFNQYQSNHPACICCDRFSFIKFSRDFPN